MAIIPKLTRAEEDIMLVLWQLGRGFVKDLIAQMPQPRPHYNTVSTLVKLLQDKGFVDYTAYGKTYEYFPLVKKEQYFRNTMKPLLKNYFNGSARQLVSFFIKEKNISLDELEHLVAEIKKKEQEKQQGLK